MQNDLTFFTKTFFSNSPDVPRIEAEINKLVYALYGLTPEEIAIVEGKR